MSTTGEMKKRDFFGKMESWAKLFGGCGAVIGAVFIPYMLHSQAEQNRKVQVYADIMSQREVADTEIRAKMFDSLLSKYLNISSNATNNHKTDSSAPKGKTSDENKPFSLDKQVNVFK